MIDLTDIQTVEAARVLGYLVLWSAMMVTLGLMSVAAAIAIRRESYVYFREERGGQSTLDHMDLPQVRESLDEDAPDVRE